MHKNMNNEIAAIAMALQQYEQECHDIESGTLTLNRKETEWNNKSLTMTHFH